MSAAFPSPCAEPAASGRPARGGGASLSARPLPRIERLQLTEFRNYEALTVPLDGRHVVLTGDNGAGKTNLLEAVSFLSPGRGMRRASYDAVTRHGAETGFAVAALLEGRAGAVRIGTGYVPGGEDEDGSREAGTRRVRVDGTNARTADELSDHLRIAWLSPASDGLFTGPAGERRRFLDRLVLALDPTHRRRTNDYERAMRQRNRLLVERPLTDRWFDGLEWQMAELGVAIATARAELCGLLGAMVERTGDGPFPRAEITLEGDAEAHVGTMPSVDVEERLRLMLAESRARDRAAGRTTAGPQTTDLQIVHAAKAMPAALCSTGEQKALLVGLVLAHARLVGEATGMPPVLLLDEIAAHLDARRRAALFDIIEGIAGQAFMTGTDRALFDALGERAQFLHVEDGRVAPHG